MNLGEYLSRLRSAKGLTLRELERLSGVSFVTITDIENGKTKSPGLKVVLALAKALNIPESNLILAYKGIDPDLQKETIPPDKIEKIMMDALKIALEKGNP